ncbi:MAG TPA: hypothetical protein VMR70_00425 [Flavisolibacter sp.]|nr:hypothetical protein [Flavisolibacter sp.]
MNRLIRLLGFLALAAFLISGCKKGTDLPGTLPVTGELKVLLDTAYVPLSAIDSAIATWGVSGQVQQQKLLLAGDTLWYPLQQLVSGRGRLTIQLYTNVRHKGLKLQFEKRWEVQLSDQSTIVIAGPLSLNDPEWLPRIIIEDKDWTGLTAIVALRTSDPYFSIRNIPARWPLVGLSRGYYKNLNGQLVAEKVWNNDGSSRQDIEDRSFFSDLNQQMSGKPWNWMTIDMDVFSLTDNQSFSFSFACPR